MTTTAFPSTVRSPAGYRRRARKVSGFGESAPAGILFKHFGFTVEHVVAAVKRVIAQ
jgi:transketolase